MSKFRIIPSIEQLRQRDAVRLLETRYGHHSLVIALRDETACLRRGLADGSVILDGSEAAAQHIETRLGTRLASSLMPSLQPLINATGIIVHTNLGRAPLAEPALDRLVTIASGYCNLEYELAAGTRGNRAAHASELLKRVTGAAAATVVNNNAAALLLVLTAMAAGREVIISRGELVEIGGGFRIPDVLRQSGARLREVGTTNRTRPEDYAAAISDETALILRVHPSNFRIEGFAERPPLSALATIAQRYEVPVVEDLGSGNLYQEIGAPPRRFEEPTVAESLAEGATMCCFSGDKILGGPQCGIIVGRAGDVSVLSRHPLMRALRVDKLVYAALEATLLEHVSGRAADTVPVTRMINLPIADLTARAEKLVGQTEGPSRLLVAIRSGESRIGGGTAPGATVNSCLLDVSIDGLSPDALETKLRGATPPVVGRIEHDRVLLDLRTVAPEDDDRLAKVLIALAEE